MVILSGAASCLGALLLAAPALAASNPWLGTWILKLSDANQKPETLIYGPMVPKEVFAGDMRAILGPLIATTGNDKAIEDTGALLSYLEARDEVAGSKVGAVGFCMGGGMAIAAAGAFPDRFAAVVSFHGGNLVNDTATSPHLAVRTLHAEILIAAAENDASYPPSMAEQFEAALAKADVSFTTSKYPAAHGWMIPDFPVYDRTAAARGWVELLALFARNLRPT